ncbi:lysine N(6)-hydroxylase/L-ornithine N(5)-oxygenase family protein [Nocardioides caldifontis]|uniref:lysine N(6)-hydroxylase/L-ornithine N(5)-oxygenase family protein n=1 Tax=Nocardioides caldifontis TaxID=2588938 RepID=UPI0011DF0489|nr:SidA/IucD/PvdA family monooxygenase [Nocardioides caldifontis]
MARVHDFVAIGLGPFNLGLACLADPVPDLDGLFLEARPDFSWHPGMMLEDASLQVPFLADLVTMADPTSPYSFLAYLKQVGRLYPFYIRESFYPLRAEYDAYCRWAAAQLDTIRFGRHVHRVEHDEAEGVYVVHAVDRATGRGERHLARRIVLGTGTPPYLPVCCRDLDGPAIHSSDYLRHRDDLRALGSVTVVGSGQSAAEIFRDLLEGVDEHGYRLSWITRSPRFFPLEYTKLTLEMTSPEYTAYFQSLRQEKRDALLKEQRGLYKGISGDLVDDIFDTLYRKHLHGEVATELRTCTEVTGVRWDGSGYDIDLHQWEQDVRFGHRTEGLVLATGYAARTPDFLDPVRHRVRTDDRGRVVADRSYAVDIDSGGIFVQNAEEHTHGFVAPDLGMGAYRNSVIIAAMTGREVYPVEKRIAFQEFGAPVQDRAVPDQPRLVEVVA